MLSYRHGFHAGNFADVLKHIVVTQVLEHLRLKAGGFDYIDTHAGAGLYDLRDARANRLREHADGIWRLAPAGTHEPVENAAANGANSGANSGAEKTAGHASGKPASDATSNAWRQWWPELESWFAVIDACNGKPDETTGNAAGDQSAAPKKPGGDTAARWNLYPGSPAIALQLLRPQDRAWLYELHPRDFEALVTNTAGRKRVKVMNQDGFRGMLGLVPPASRRGLVLIDPSYEIKEDYDIVFSTVARAARKFATGTYIVWYPVVDRNRVQRLERQFGASGIRNILQLELGVMADGPDRGMTGAGVFVINPPWTLRERMTGLLPRLKTALSEDRTSYARCIQLVAE